MKRPITIGMATYRDFAGVWETVQHLRLLCVGSAILRDAEILIVDNCPDSDEGRMVRDTWRSWWAGPRPGAPEIRYVEMPRPVGTAAPRQRVFEEAAGDVVLCLDSHVLLWPGAPEAVSGFFADPAHARDMLQGPLVYDDLATVSTHFDDRWRGEMWGTWGTDPRGLDPGGEPLEIFAQGLGLFAMRRDAWVGFSPKFLGFGGEECYVHHKVRRRGGKVFCHPAVRWVHRFGRPGGVKYPLNGWYKTRNYVIGLAELGLPLDRLHRHMVEGWEEGAPGEAPIQRPGPYPMDHVGWALLTADPSNPPAWPSDQPLPPELQPLVPPPPVAADTPAPQAILAVPPSPLPSSAPDGVRMWEPASMPPAPPAPAAPPNFGPGTELKAMLASLGIAENLACDCNARAAQMDLWGVEGCRANRETIIGWLRDGQGRWGWKDKIAAGAKAVSTGLAFRVNWLDPFPGLVDEAIRRADSAPPALPAPAGGG